jgi:hypothetical protein
MASSLAGFESAVEGFDNLVSERPLTNVVTAERHGFLVPFFKKSPCDGAQG